MKTYTVYFSEPVTLTCVREKWNKEKRRWEEQEFQVSEDTFTFHSLAPAKKLIWNETGKERTEKKEKRNQELKMEAAKDMQREYFNEVQEEQVITAGEVVVKETKEVPIGRKHDLNLYGAYKDILEGVKRLEEKVGSLYYRNTPDHIRVTVYDAMSGAILSAEQKLGVQLKLYSDRELVEELRERGYKILSLTTKEHCVIR